MLLDFPFNLKYVAAALIAIIVSVFVIERHGRKNSLKKRRYHPVAGTVLHQLLNFERLHDYMTELASEYTTYRLLSLGRREIYTSDPINVEHILKTNFPNYGKGWYQYEILRDLLGDGIFTVDGEKWKHQRKAASYQFSTKLLKDFSSSVFKSNAVKLAGIVSSAAISNQIFEIKDLFDKSTLDSVFKVVLGIELDTMCGTYEEGKRFSNAFDEASSSITLRYVDVFWKIKKFLNVGSEAVLKKNVKVVDEFVCKVIRSKIEQVQKSPDELVKKGDILSRFLELEETDPQYLKDIILSFIIAGKDTTGTTLSWFFYLLCKHPHVQEKIAQEVKEATKSSEFSSIDELAARITAEALEKMQYLHATLTETLRLYPSVPWDAKFCFSDDTWPDGFSVSKGDLVAYQPYAMGRMKNLWGNNAEEFQPERWLDSNGVFQQQSPFKFTAFQGEIEKVESTLSCLVHLCSALGKEDDELMIFRKNYFRILQNQFVSFLQAGPRICLGKEFSYRQMKIFAAVLLGSHKFKLSDQKKSLHYKTAITLQIDGPLHLHAYPRLAKLRL